MSNFHLIIASPDGNLFDGEAAELSVRGTEGELAVLAGHIPFITSVKPCRCRVEFEDGTEKTGETKGGLLAVSKETVTLLASDFRWLES